MTISYYHKNTQSLGEQDKNIFQILRSMASDEYDCHYCINHHTTHHDTTEILRIHGALIERQTRLVLLRHKIPERRCFEYFWIILFIII